MGAGGGGTRHRIGRRWHGLGARGAGGGLPSDGSQLGMSGVSPPWPPFALEVPISVAPLDCACAAQHSLRP